MDTIIQCPKCNGNMFCETTSENPHTYQLRCPNGHVWDLVEVKPRRVIDTCVFCGKPFYDGDDWTNYLPKEVVVKKGQDAADAYLKRQCKAICPGCEKVHPTSRQHHDSIMWARLIEEYKK